MDFEINDDQKSYIDSVVQFAAKTFPPTQPYDDQSFNESNWKHAANFGFAGLPVPEEWGGSGLNVLDTILMVEALGKSCPDLGLIFSLCAHMFACTVPVWNHGSALIKEKYLHDLASGKLIAANAITEPSSGSDVYNMKTTAKFDNGYYYITGEKCFITNAPVADIFLVYAKTNTEQSFLGISCFLVPKKTTGLFISQNRKKSGLASTPWADIYLNNCFIPQSHLLGSLDVGALIFHDSMIWERSCLFAAYVGAMERALEKCISHAKERHQFGKPICHNQAISDKLVDIKARLETSRLLLYKVGQQSSQGKPNELDVALSKLWISESAVQTGLDAIQIFGGMGISKEVGIDRLLLDSLPARIFSGTSEVQRELIAKQMGLR
ncbi:acyl-CoA dehydrogenase family protein [Spartinivicinus poritis]|uniref:Acyl-CoA/acyl-ACP dehydrogenase n=1 Tax=Spartinivicinus poritis TaxID=2994640 RepID=A0ABT5U576_9GAMM|nr:acyl-CoA dehydrogenase family protein [Spartinivicinus sp. A2-2]MDE1461509.1 acyl-CoA/acyl-ACP dehydrogenase [Spartinivicinus sp. A2-2]